MAKIKTLVITKYHGGDKYKFENGIALVPGLRISKQPVFISLSAFKELTQKESPCVK